METNTIVYFYEKKEKQKENKWRKISWRKPQCSVDKVCWKERKVIMIALPRQLTRTKDLYRQLKDILQEEEEDFFFFWHPSVETRISFLQQVVAIERTPHLPEDIRQELMTDCGRFEALIIREGAELDIRELLTEWCKRLNYLAIITDGAEHYMEMAEDIYEEYGLPVVLTNHLTDARPLEGQKVLVIDGNQEKEKMWRDLPKNCTYLDLTVNREWVRTLKAKRKDIYYVSFVNVLDTMCQNRYNT